LTAPFNDEIKDYGENIVELNGVCLENLVRVFGKYYLKKNTVIYRRLGVYRRFEPRFMKNK
jgi:hypothetical protein